MMNIFMRVGLIIIGIILIATQINYLCALGGILIGIALTYKNNDDGEWAFKIKKHLMVG